MVCLQWPVSASSCVALACGWVHVGSGNCLCYHACLDTRQIIVTDGFEVISSPITVVTGQYLHNEIAICPPQLHWNDAQAYYVYWCLILTPSFALWAIIHCLRGPQTWISSNRCIFNITGMQIELLLFNSLVAKCEPVEDTLKIYHIIAQES